MTDSPEVSVYGAEWVLLDTARHAVDLAIGALSRPDVPQDEVRKLVALSKCISERQRRASELSGISSEEAGE